MSNEYTLLYKITTQQTSTNFCINFVHKYIDTEAIRSTSATHVISGHCARNPKIR